MLAVFFKSDDRVRLLPRSSTSSTRTCCFSVTLYVTLTRFGSSGNGVTLESKSELRKPPSK